MGSHLKFSLPAILGSLLVLPFSNALAEEHFYSAPLSEILSPEVQASLSQSEPPNSRPGRRYGGLVFNNALFPFAHTADGGEAYILCNEKPTAWMAAGRGCRTGKLEVRTNSATPPSGLLVLVNEANTRTVRAPFTLTAKHESAGGRDDFFTAKENYYAALLFHDTPGLPWFRNQFQEAHKAHDWKGVQTPASPNRFPFRNVGPNNLDETYKLFSGGRAVSENLQLDRSLLLTSSSAETIELSTITGINVSALDWTEKLKGKNPELDPLAAIIPADQYAILFPTFDALIRVSDEANESGGEILSVFEERSEDAEAKERYQQQLCLPMSEVSRLLGPTLVKSVAITGSDPYFRTGTDVAVLFEARQKDALVALLSARLAEAKGKNGDAETVKGSVAGISYSGVVTKDRRISAYLSSVGDTVLVTNSLMQLEKIANTSFGKTSSLNSLGEYRYFRDRYPRSAPEESAFLMVSDAAIRKWGSPEWRIADSRRTRAAAVLSELQAKYLVSEISKPLAISSEEEKTLAPLGELSREGDGIRSSKYGTLGFLTPISELQIQKVSSEEATAYGRFRDTYSSYWRGYFDPLAIRFSFDEQKRGIDLSITPLIASSDYRPLMELANGKGIDEYSGDFHKDALLGVTLAIDSNSKPFTQWGGFGSMLLPGVSNPLGWIGNSVSVYLDESSLWKQAGESESQMGYLEEHYQQIPLGVFIEVQDSLKLSTILTSLKTRADQTARGLSSWENKTYKSTPYVEIREVRPSNPNLRPNTRPLWSLYYAVTPNFLILSLQEEVLFHAIDRLASRSEPAQKEARAFALGSNLSVEVSKQFLGFGEGLFGQTQIQTLRQRCWNNIPILNEWKRIFPERDPLLVHEKIWKTRLLCPAGGTYVWNDEWKTMESTTVGHPGAPKEAKLTLPALAGVEKARFALAFEGEGLRAKVDLVREAR